MALLTLIYIDYYAFMYRKNFFFALCEVDQRENAKSAKILFVAVGACSLTFMLSIAIAWHYKMWTMLRDEFSIILEILNWNLNFSNPLNFQNLQKESKNYKFKFFLSENFLLVLPNSIDWNTLKAHNSSKQIFHHSSSYYYLILCTFMFCTYTYTQRTESNKSKKIT